MRIYVEGLNEKGSLSKQKVFANHFSFFRLGTLFLEDVPQRHCYRGEGGKENEEELHKKC